MLHIVYNFMKDYNPVVSIRIPVAMLERMDQIIATGRYRNRPDYIMAAIRLLEEMERDKERSAASTGSKGAESGRT